MVDRPQPTDYVGKSLLFGIAWFSADEELLDQAEYVGEIVGVDESAIHVVTSSGKEIGLPPQLGALQKAEPGEYTLRSTLEIVRDPDYVAVYSQFV